MNTDRRGQKRRGRAVAVWLDEGDIVRLKEIAREKGIGHTTLIRMWIREKLTELRWSGDPPDPVGRERGSGRGEGRDKQGKEKESPAVKIFPFKG